MRERIREIVGVMGVFLLAYSIGQRIWCCKDNLNFNTTQAAFTCCQKYWNYKMQMKKDKESTTTCHSEIVRISDMEALKNGFVIIT